MPHRHEHTMHETHNMHTHAPVKIHLSHHQISKIRQGKTVQIPIEHIGHHQGRVFRHLHPTNLEKLKKAHHAKRGVRLHLTTHELHGTGFLDILKKIASPVLSGLQGVAKEIFPSHAGTIDKIRNGIRTATGYGLKTRKQNHHGDAMNSHGFYNGNGVPHHFPGEKSDHYGFGIKHTKKRGTKKHRKHHLMHGEGINPSGFY